MITVYGGALYAPNIADSEKLEEESLALEWLTKRTARHEYFMSQTPTEYSYGNTGMGEEHYTSKPFTSEVLKLMFKLNEDLGSNFNGCFLNKYDSEKQHLGWHADDFEGMDPNQPIAVVSLGAEREIWLKKQFEQCPCITGKVSKVSFNDGNASFSGVQNCPECKGKGLVNSKGNIPDDQKILLKRGSLFVMPKGFQDTYFHRIPKHDRPCGWRISLTFRSFL